MHLCCQASACLPAWHARNVKCSCPSVQPERSQRKALHQSVSRSWISPLLWVVKVDKYNHHLVVLQHSFLEMKAQENCCKKKRHRKTNHQQSKSTCLLAASPIRDSDAQSHPASFCWSDSPRDLFLSMETSKSPDLNIDISLFVTLQLLVVSLGSCKYEKKAQENQSPTACYFVGFSYGLSVSQQCFPLTTNQHQQTDSD